MMHRRVCLLGVVALLFVAVWLWESHDVFGDCMRAHDEAAEHYAARAAQAVSDGDPRGLQKTYDHGRTTIAPKISAAMVARIRGA